MDKKKVNSIQSWPRPTRTKELQSFLGFANFYRRFIRNFSAIVKPFTNLLKKDVKFVWMEQHSRAFEALKAAFDSSPLLAHANANEPFVLETDASSFAIGCVLSQKTNGRFHPCGFYSRKLLPAEMNYPVFDRELLAIKEGFNQWRHLLEGAKHIIKVITDHQNLRHLVNMKITNSRHANWSLFFSRFNFEIIYRKGSENGKTDALSRRIDYKSESNRFEDEKRILPPSCVSAIGYNSSTFEILDRPTIQQVLRFFHDSPFAGHPGISKTTELIQRYCRWKGMNKDIHDFVSSCESCMQNKVPRRKPFGFLQPLSIPKAAWKSIAMDFITDLPESDGMTCVLTVVDRFTKYARFIPFEKLPTAQELCRVLYDHIFVCFGVPDEIISDRGAQFISHYFRRFLNACQIKQCLSSAYHPQSDGQSERSNQILIQYLRHYTNEYLDNWCELLELAEFAINNTFQSSIRTSPHFAVFGKHPSLPQAIKNLFPIPEISLPVPDVHNLIREAISESQKRMKHFADRKRSAPPVFKIGDFVWLSTRNLHIPGAHSKLSRRFIGPFRVIRVLSKISVQLQLPSVMRIHPVFHVSLLKAHKQRPASLDSNETCSLESRGK